MSNAVINKLNIKRDWVRFFNVSNQHYKRNPQHLGRGFRGGLGIVGDNKRKYTQLVKTVYEIVYRLCKLLIFSVFCGA